MMFCNKNRRKDPRRKILRQVIRKRIKMWLPSRDFLPSVYRFSADGVVVVYVDLRYVRRWKNK